MAKVKKLKKYVFVRGSLPTIAWDPVKGVPLAEFCDPTTKRVTGKFTTTSKSVARRLKEMGYKAESEYPDDGPVGGFKPRDPEPVTHITPGGPKPDLVVEETVTPETLPDEIVAPSKKKKPKSASSKKKVVLKSKGKVVRKKTLSKE